MLSMREKPIVRAQLSVASKGSSTAAGTRAVSAFSRYTARMWPDGAHSSHMGGMVMRMHAPDDSRTDQGGNPVLSTPSHAAFPILNQASHPCANDPLREGTYTLSTSRPRPGVLRASALPAT